MTAISYHAFQNPALRAMGSGSSSGLDSSEGGEEEQPLDDNLEIRYVRVHAGFEALCRIKLRSETVNACEHLKAWRVLEWPLDDVSRSGTKKKRFLSPGDGKIYATHLSLSDRCATVAIAPAVGRCLVTILDRSSGRVSGTRGGLRGVFSDDSCFVERAVLVKPDWVLKHVQDVFDLKCDRLMAQFKWHYRKKLPVSDEIFSSATAMEARVLEAVANSDRFHPNALARRRLNAQRHKFLKCFWAFPFSGVYVDASSDVVTIRVRATKGRGGNPGGVVSTSDARVRRIVKAYLKKDREKWFVDESSAVARWLALYVGTRCRPSRDGDDLWIAVLSSIGHAATALLHLVACDLLPNLAHSLGGGWSKPMLLRLARGVDHHRSHKTQDDEEDVALVTTDDDTAAVCGYEDVYRVEYADAEAAADQPKRKNACTVEPGTSASSGMITGVSLFKDEDQGPDIFLLIA